MPEFVELICNNTGYDMDYQAKTTFAKKDRKYAYLERSLASWFKKIAASNKSSFPLPSPSLPLSSISSHADKVVNMTKLAKIDGMGRTRLVHVLLQSGLPPVFSYII